MREAVGSESEHGRSGYKFLRLGVEGAGVLKAVGGCSLGWGKEWVAAELPIPGNLK